MSTRVRALFVFAACSFAGCAHSPPRAAGASTSTASAWTLDRTTFDPSADPCTDFYQHVCGGWAARARIPADRPALSFSDDRVRAANRAAVEQLLTAAEPSTAPATGHADDVELRRLRTFYRTCITSNDRDATLRRWLERIDEARTRAAWMVELRALHAIGVRPFFQYLPETDPANQGRYRGVIQQGTLGLYPTAYAAKGAKEEEALRAYRAHVKHLFGLAGIPTPRAESEADTVVALEAKIAAATADDPAFNAAEPGEHLMAPEALGGIAPHVDWRAYLTMVGHPDDRQVNVASPRYLEVVDAILANTPLADLRACLRWAFLRALVTALPTPFVEAQHGFEELPGVERPPAPPNASSKPSKASASSCRGNSRSASWGRRTARKPSR